MKVKQTGMKISIKEFWLTTGEKISNTEIIITDRPDGVDPSDPNNLDPDIEYIKNMNWFTNLTDAEIQQQGKQIVNQIMSNIAKQKNTTVDTTKLISVNVKRWVAPQPS
jgi:hypothetical protein